jgi:hypothetical protein
MPEWKPDWPEIDSSRSEPRYSDSMLKLPLSPPLVVLGATLFAAGTTAVAAAQNPSSWTFAVSGDSRNCGDFVMPAIASKVKAEKDAFYWHLGDFRWMSKEDEDMTAMKAGENSLSLAEYQERAWDNFLQYQMTSFEGFPIFLGRGNHENVKPMTREGYIAKFSSFLSRPEIVAQRKADGDAETPFQSWYHWTENGVDFITLDNAAKEEFSDAQLRWLRAVLDRDLAANSGVHTIVAGMHEALPHSTTSNHAMDDWELGVRSGETVYNWFLNAQTLGKHVYILASHSHYYAPNIYDTAYWREHGDVVPGIIIGSAGARRYVLPAGVDKRSKTNIYGYLRGTVHPDGSIEFGLHELSENDLVQSRWPNAPLEAIHECYIHNSEAVSK